MIKSTVEKMAKPIGFEIGTSDDHLQADLLNGFCKGLHNSIQMKSDLDMQLCYIADRLDKTTEDILIGLVGFINLNRENKNNNK